MLSNTPLVSVTVPASSREAFIEHSPLVSVIIPAYNAEPFIKGALNAVLTQTYQHLEVIVVDDGSTDSTADIVKEIAQRDDRVTLIQQTNSGVAAARNLGIRHSKGEFVAPIDADDIWHPQNIEKQIQCMLQADSSVGVVYAWSFDIDEKNQPTGNFHSSIIEGKVYVTLLCHYFLGHGSCSLIRRDCLDKVGGYNPQFKNSCEDWDLYLRIAEDYEFRAVPEFLVCYRKKTNGLSQNLALMREAHNLMLQSACKKHLEIPSSIYRLSNSSFCIYLAHQSYFRKDFRSTLLWIYQAFRSSFILSLFRLSVYIVSFKSIFRLAVSYSKFDQKEGYHCSQKYLNCAQKLSNSEELPLFPNFSPNQTKRQLKTLIEGILHQLTQNTLKELDNVSSTSTISWKS